jgi:hypothetical protein
VIGPRAATEDGNTASMGALGDAGGATPWSQVRFRRLAAAAGIALAGAAVPILVGQTGDARVAAEPDAHPFLDLLTSCALATTTAVALSIPVLARLGRANRRAFCRSNPRAICFFVTTAVGAAYLAADELLGFHEALVERYPRSSAWPLLGRADNWVFALYGVLVLLFLVAFRSILTTSVIAPALLIGAAAAFMPDTADAVAASRFAVGDQTGDWLELGSSLLLLSGIIAVGLAQLGGRLQPSAR